MSTIEFESSLDQIKERVRLGAPITPKTPLTEDEEIRQAQQRRQEKQLQIEQRRVENFVATCQKKLLPIFQQARESVFNPQEATIDHHRETNDGLTAFVITLHWTNTSARKPWHKSAQISMRVIMDAWVMDGEQPVFCKNAHIIDSVSAKSSQITPGGHIKRCYVNPIALQGRQTSKWQSAVEQEIISQLKTQLEIS